MDCVAGVDDAEYVRNGLSRAMTGGAAAACEVGLPPDGCALSVQRRTRLQGIAVVMTD